MLTRRGLITGLVSFVAAPAIVRVSSIMPVRSVKFVARQTDQFLRDGIFPGELFALVFLKPQAQRDAGNRQGDQE